MKGEYGRAHTVRVLMLPLIATSGLLEGGSEYWGLERTASGRSVTRRSRSVGTYG